MLSFKSFVLYYYLYKIEKVSILIAWHISDYILQNLNAASKIADNIVI